MSKFKEKVVQETDNWERMLRLQRVERRNQRIAKSKEDKHRNYIIGELVSKYFHEILNFKPGNKEHNSIEFAPFETFLKILADDKNLMERLKKEVIYRLSLDDP